MSDEKGDVIKWYLPFQQSKFFGKETGLDKKGRDDSGVRVV
jgi:hypothetical protein